MNSKEIRYLTKDFEIRAKEDGTKTVTGYVVKFNKRSQLIWGEFYEKVAKGAFSKSLEENTIKALWNHRSDYILGSTKNGTLRLEEDDIGLRFELDLPNNTWGNDAYESIQRGDTDGVSFGFVVRNDNWEYIKDEDVYERTLLDVDLFEISPTPFPAYPDSEVGKRSMEGIPDTKEERHKRKEQEIHKRKLLLELEL
ncbi:HK97 family phage prohead protease [Brevibacillus agri]|uniref:HK97 family phage prohead protease n=1 Tax=Brevibacillus agri TaxID=51101 RepID=UPI0025B69CD9|nr:HK97 family phage prohead protease [Brevibacillus agri]MDN4093568.1 HK97 family phage prohead protease [Brevibacillus agri]